MSPIEQRKGRGRPRSLKTAIAGGAVQALDRGLALLEILADEDGLTLSELARRSGVSASTAHRVLLTLESRAYVQHDMERQQDVSAASGWSVSAPSRPARLSCATAASRAWGAPPCMR